MEGSCLCGAVRFTLTRAAGPFELCHCRRCRKSSGSAFSAGLGVDPKDLQWRAGQDQVVTYSAPFLRRPPPYQRSFCRCCGSPVPGLDEDRVPFEVPAGVLDGDPGVRPDRHIFVELKAPWFEIRDPLPQLDAAALVALRRGQPVAGPARRAPVLRRAADTLHGSCLCGGVRFTLRGKGTLLRSCHCSRCRKAHGTAFATVAMVQRQHFAYECGEDLATPFQSSARVCRPFCRTCGSRLPICEDRDPLVGIPAGLLDDDPGELPHAHIFVGSKAAWWTISDATPQSEAWPPGADMEGRAHTLQG